MKLRLVMVAAVLVLVSPMAQASSRTFVAFSLRQAEKQLAAGSREVNELGGITEPVAFVYDAVNDDYLLVGVADPRKPAISLESFVAALRARETPEVSINPAQPGSDPHQQPVVFHGGLENTRLGADLLDADIALKKLALGMLRADVWGVRSYLALSVDDAKKNGSVSEINSRFWLRAGERQISGNASDGVMVVNRCKARVDTEILATGNEKRDVVGEDFSAQVAASFPELAMQYPELARVLPILRLVAIAQEMAHQRRGESLDFWLSNYQIPKVPTHQTYELTQASQAIPGTDKEIVLSGGIDTSPLTIRLISGDATAVREVVLKSRPSPQAIVWGPPLDGLDYTDEDSVSGPDAPSDSPDGFYMNRVTITSPVPGNSNFTRPYTPPPAPLLSDPSNWKLSIPSVPPPPISARPPAPSFPGTSNLTQSRPLSPPPVMWNPPHSSDRVGGVMLQATASVSGDNSPVDLLSKNFALVMDGQNVRPDNDTFRKFVTALWAVYYSDQDPGISIDPISPDSDKHLVRYIGDVINTDLGRVMREADYQMKKWAVGTERANIPGFKNPDDFMAKVGLRANAWSRFWFVPQDMTFQRAGDTLLFSSGKMTVCTEYLSDQSEPDPNGTCQHDKRHTEPANEKFAQLFTDQYDTIAKSYPVYKELFEYAKLVSLAKYLKDSGVPLTWFLLANKDLVITEDSPGTVDALAHGSNYYRNLYIKGGVNLNTQGKYVLDPTAMAAIQEAQAHSNAGPSSRSTIATAPTISRTPNEPFSFKLEKASYSVVPQSSVTSGKDQSGNRYQTDIALRNGTKPGLELVRYFDARIRGQGEFGKGWRLLVPYRIKPVGEEMMDFLNARVPVKMAIENLMTGRSEVLTFSSDRYSIAGYVPDKLATSQVVGLFVLSNASFRLADKFGNEFWFDQAGKMSDMVFANQERIHYQFLEEATNAFEHPPFEIRPDGAETVEFRGETLPKRIIVRDAGHPGEEKLQFDLTQDVASYFPIDESNSRYKSLRWTARGGYRLEDKHGNLARFKTDGEFEALLPELDSALIQSVSMGSQEIDMTYEIGSDGKIVIAKAILTTGDQSPPQLAVRYHYNEDGTLARTERTYTKEQLAMGPWSGR
jgi:hypothetical protein